MKWVCVFRDEFVRTQVDPRIQALWKERRDEPAPFGALRSIWRTAHCETLNPYGSEDCLYEAQQCALAFYAVATNSIQSDKPRNRFHALAKETAITRADTKPLARDRIPNDGSQRPSDPGATRAHLHPGPTSDIPGVAEVPTELDRVVEGLAQPGVSERDMRRGSRGLESVHEVLRTLDIGPHQRPAKDGKESTQR